MSNKKAERGVRPAEKQKNGGPHCGNSGKILRFF